MLITALDTSFNAVAVIEAYISFIWTDRYTDTGDFELYVPATAPYLNKIRNDFYIACTSAIDGELERLMVVEKIDYKTDLDEGNKVLITGRSLESILSRRIIWKDDGSITEINRSTIHAKIPSIGDNTWTNDTTSEFPLQNGIQYLLDMNIINPKTIYGTTNELRQITTFTFVESTDTRITNLTLRPCSYRGNNLYDVIRSICDMYSISFKVSFNSATSKFVFKLYKGDSHLSSQTDNGYVCFSTEFDNLISSDTSLDMSTYKTMAYFMGKGEKWIVKDFSRTEACQTGWIRFYNDRLYACKLTYDETTLPRENVPPNDPDAWALIMDWSSNTRYNANSYVSYGINVYRIDHNVVEYNSESTYSAGAVLMHNRWMYVSLVDNNDFDIDNTSDPEWENHWYKCADESECFNAQQWEQVQSTQKESYDVFGDVQNQSTSGMDRRELFVDATNVPSSYTYYPDGITEFTYILERGLFEATLRDKALSELTIPGNRPTKNFDCEVETNVSFKYGKDYKIGDIVEVKDTYGYIDSVVVDSYIISHEESGEFKSYPTFESVESSTIITKYLQTDMELSTGTFLLKIPESARFKKATIIATSKYNDTTYYLMSFYKYVTTDSKFSFGKAPTEMHMVAWTTDTTVYTDGRYQSDDDLYTVGPHIVGTPLFYIYIDLEAGDGNVLPAIINPSWIPPSDVNLGTITSVDESADQYKNILIANL